MKNKFLQLTNQTEDSADLYIYGDIVDEKWYWDEVTANDVRENINGLDVKEINVHINSYGGSVFTAIAIYNLLRQHKAKINVYIDSLAASAASVIAMAGDTIYMPKNSLMMIHNCWIVVVGNSEDLRKTANDMDKIMESSIETYMSKVKISKEELIKLLDAETWLTAAECVEKGFADQIIELKEEGNVNQSTTLFNLVQKTRKLETPKQEEVPTTKVENLEEQSTEIGQSDELETVEDVIEQEETKMEENPIAEKNLKKEILEKLKGKI